jgi:mediator of RNA polymerase II transcription subunit 6
MWELQASISSSITKLFPILDSVQTWSPAQGRIYHNPTQKSTAKPRAMESKESTPRPDGAAKAGAAASEPSRSAKEAQLVEQSLAIHERYGHEYMDLNPITGRPGEFHLTSTGRKEKPQPPKTNPGPLSIKDSGLPNLNTKVGESPLAKNGKDTKSPKTPSIPKPKRRKSKMATTPGPS